MAFRIAISHRLEYKLFDSLKEHHKLIEPKEDEFSKEELLGHIKHVDIIITIFGFVIDKSMMDQATNLRLIANYGAGYNNIDTDYAVSKGIHVTNTPLSVVEPTAELGMGLLLSLSRKIAYLHHQIVNHETIRWGLFDNLGMTLQHKKLGVIGCGRIGTSFARKAKAFGMEISYYNRNRKPESIEMEIGMTYKPFEKILKDSDVISINTPLSKKTYHLIDEPELSKIKRGGLIINTARGAVINERALIKFLANGHLGGAGLDVFENEPEIPHELRKLDNVVLVPHIGTASYDDRKGMGDEVIKNVNQFINGEEPDALVC